MLKLMEGNKRYLFWALVFGLFGIVGLLMVPIVKCIIRVSERHPKACRWISIVAFISIAICLFIEQGWNSRFVLICIGVVLAINSMFNEYSCAEELHSPDLRCKISRNTQFKDNSK